MKQPHILIALSLFDECLGITVDNNDMTHSFDEFLREALTMNSMALAFMKRFQKLGRKKFGVNMTMVR